MTKVAALVHTWLVLDFFGDARRSGGTSTSSLTTTIFTQSFLALVFASLMYPETPPVPFAAANLCLSSLLVAIGTLGDHDQQNRRRADQALLGTAPVSRSSVVLARSGYAAFYVCLVTIGMALPPGILLGFWTGSVLQTVAYVMLACACSALATGALAVTVRGLVRCLGPVRAALVAGTVKATVLGGGVALFALGMQNLQRNADGIPGGRLVAELLPPYHAARLLAYPEELWRIAPFLGGALLLLFVAIAIGETEAARPASHSHGGPLLRLLHHLAGRGPRLGIAEFVAVSIWRSPGFRSRVLPLLGLPVGMVFLSLQGGVSRHGYVFLCLLLQLPAIYLPFLIAFLPRADQTGTGWVFEQAPGLSLELVHDAVWRALVTHVVLPVHVLALALALAFAPAAFDAAAASLFACSVAVIAARPMLRSLGTVPFTQHRDADAATDLGGLFVFAILLGGLGGVFGALLLPWQRWPTAILGVLAAGWLLRRQPAPGAATSVPVEPAPFVALDSQTDLFKEDMVERRPVSSALGRELRAILVLYAASCLLPAAIGIVFRP